MKKLERHSDLHRLNNLIYQNPLTIKKYGGFFYVVENKTGLVVSLRPGYKQPIRKKSLEKLLITLKEHKLVIRKKEIYAKTAFSDKTEKQKEKILKTIETFNIISKQKADIKREEKKEQNPKKIDSIYTPQVKKKHRFFG